MANPEKQQSKGSELAWALGIITALFIGVDLLKN